MQKYHENILKIIKENYPDTSEEAIETAYILGLKGVPRVFGLKGETNGTLIHGLNCDCQDSCIEQFCPECGECDMVGFNRCSECKALMTD